MIKYEDRAVKDIQKGFCMLLENAGVPPMLLSSLLVAEGSIASLTVEKTVHALLNLAVTAVEDPGAH